VWENVSRSWFNLRSGSGRVVCRNCVPIAYIEEGFDEESYPLPWAIPLSRGGSVPSTVFDLFLAASRSSSTPLKLFRACVQRWEEEMPFLRPPTFYPLTLLVETEAEKVATLAALASPAEDEKLALSVVLEKDLAVL
jgi:hypothetical protein